ncbi:MAG: hypothetical protein R3C11_04790 [Planctomycetaceae bacterium]
MAQSRRKQVSTMPMDFHHHEFKSLLERIVSNPKGELKILTVRRLYSFLAGWFSAASIDFELGLLGCRLDRWRLEHLDGLSYERWDSYVNNRHGNGEESFFIGLSTLHLFLEYDVCEEFKNEFRYVDGMSKPDRYRLFTPSLQDHYLDWHRKSVYSLIKEITGQMLSYVESYSLSRLDAYLWGWSLASEDPDGNRKELCSFFQYVKFRFSTGNRGWWEGIERIYGENSKSVTVARELFNDFQSTYENNM